MQTRSEWCWLAGIGLACSIAIVAGGLGCSSRASPGRVPSYGEPFSFTIDDRGAPYLVELYPTGRGRPITDRDRHEMDSLIYRWALQFDLIQDIDAIAELFAEDGMMYSFISHLEGREAIRARLSEWIDEHGGPQALRRDRFAFSEQRLHAFVNEVYEDLRDDPHTPAVVRRYSRVISMAPNRDMPPEAGSFLEYDKAAQGYGVYGIGFIGFYVHDFVREDGEWKIKLYHHSR